MLVREPRTGQLGAWRWAWGSWSGPDGDLHLHGTAAVRWGGSYGSILSDYVTMKRCYRKLDVVPAFGRYDRKYDGRGTGRRRPNDKPELLLHICVKIRKKNYYLS